MIIKINFILPVEAKRRSHHQGRVNPKDRDRACLVARYDGTGVPKQIEIFVAL